MTAPARPAPAPIFLAAAGLLAFLFIACAPVPARAWGLAAHAMITRQAVEACPEPLRWDLRAHREALVERSLEPDTVLRPKNGRRESVRHFINLEHLGRPPFRNIPSNEGEAVAKFGRRRIDRAGELPWAVAEAYARMVGAMRRDNREAAIREMGYMAHYAADAFSPLHTTKNHDGQLTGNDGIHRRYETALIERRAKFFRDPGGVQAVPGRTIQDVSGRVLEIVREGNALIPPLLEADRKALGAGRAGTGANLDALFREVGESARDRMRGAARETAALWTSAWIEAGRPPLAGKKTGGCQGC